MKKTIKELFEIEKRDPVSIANWLKGEGHKDEHIELALAEFAEKIAKGERFGYANGISVLSNKIRDRARELNKVGAEDLVARLGKFEVIEDSGLKKFSKRIWKQLNRRIF
jgi:hypothetical protein